MTGGPRDEAQYHADAVTEIDVFVSDGEFASAGITMEHIKNMTPARKQAETPILGLEHDTEFDSEETALQELGARETVSKVAAQASTSKNSVQASASEVAAPSTSKVATQAIEQAAPTSKIIPSSKVISSARIQLNNNQENCRSTERSEEAEIPEAPMAKKAKRKESNGAEFFDECLPDLVDPALTRAQVAGKKKAKRAGVDYNSVWQSDHKGRPCPHQLEGRSTGWKQEVKTWGSSENSRGFIL